MIMHNTIEYHVRTKTGRTAMVFDIQESAERFQKNNPHWRIIKVTRNEEDVTPSNIENKMSSVS
jgi:hypothetical protein